MGGVFFGGYSRGIAAPGESNGKENGASPIPLYHARYHKWYLLESVVVEGVCPLQNPIYDCTFHFFHYSLYNPSMYNPELRGIALLNPKP